MVVCLPNSREGTKTKVENCYDNRSDNIDIVQSLSKCDLKGPLAINIVKLYNNEQMGTFYAFGRIISGTIKSGEQVKVLGENYTIEEQEDMVV
jgi:U5 small nuclear ribonucleoprotein component